MKLSGYVRVLLAVLLCVSIVNAVSWNSPNAGNPVMPGYFADPAILVEDGKFYVYATVDPWGANEYALLISEDFVNWELHHLNWPTKEACQTPESTDATVWAPGVVKGKNGNFYMYASVGSEIWVGIANDPKGPWVNPLGDKPMIATQADEGIHTIDADCFIDDDGRIYLYWGSGLNWINGHCIVAELNDDMISFKSEFKDITPPNYFEGPHMIKRNGKYYLTYSDGKVIEDTYKVRYAVSDSPVGPFKEGKNSPILKTNADHTVDSPGHHWVLTIDGKEYIVYHRHDNPLTPGGAHRQICIDPLEYDSAGNIKAITPSHSGVGPLVDYLPAINLAFGKKVKASYNDSVYPARYANDQNNGTLWKSDIAKEVNTLEIDLEKLTEIQICQIDFQYPLLKYAYKIECSADGKIWNEIVDNKDNPVSQMPHKFIAGKLARYIRVTTYGHPTEQWPTAIWEVKVF